MDWIDTVECPACLVVGRVYGLRKAGVSHKAYPSYLARLASLIAEGGRTKAFVESFALLVSIAGFNPSREDKIKLNEAMIEAKAELEKIMEQRDILGILEVSAAANAVDVEMLGYRFEGDLIRVLGEKPVYVWLDASELITWLKGASRIAWLLDNAGEAVVDIVAAAALAERLGVNITLYARSEEYETDVTADEARRIVKRLGLNLEVRGSGSRYPPHHPRSETRAEIGNHDVVISKGIANFETLLEAPLEGVKTVALLRAKCKPLAKLFGVKTGMPVITTPSRSPVRLRG